MGDSAMATLAIFLAAVLMFVFPLIALADKKDDITTLTVQTATTEFVDGITVKGKITEEDYSNYVKELAATGNSYDVELTLQVVDINPSKKEAEFRIGDNTYYVMYTKQILDALNSGDGVLNLKEGDRLSVTATNTSTTISGQLKNIWYNFTGNTKEIGATATAMVTKDGQ